jgi:DNA-binding MarR family transcriptional regulator
MNLVERHAEPDDARVVRVQLTEEGQERAAAIEALWGDVEKELLDGFDGKERKRLRKMLRKAAKNLAEVSGADARDLADDDLDELSEPAARLAVPA